MSVPQAEAKEMQDPGLRGCWGENVLHFFFVHKQTLRENLSRCEILYSANMIHCMFEKWGWKYMDVLTIFQWLWQ